MFDRLLLCSLLVCSAMSTGGDKGVDSDLYVQTTSGIVEGRRYKTSHGNVKIFQGIPYAKPPVGKRRFQPSEVMSDLNEKELKREIKFESSVPACMQRLHIEKYSHPSLPQGGLKVSEDCLKLSLYMPSDVEKYEKLPIVVWIPGDGFQFADGSQYDGTVMASLGRIIVVVVNYRVGIFGFLSSGTSAIPGNAGLHDIQNALRWVAYNGDKFNGETENITLAGRFSGAMAISTLMSSPMFLRTQTKPWASKIILHGGTAGGHYTLEREPEKSYANFIGIMDCDKSDDELTLDCLSKLSGQEILEKSQRLFQSWRPTIDGKLVVGDPLSRVEMGQFPKALRVMIGDNGGSGSLCYLTQSFMETNFSNNLEGHYMLKSELLVQIQKIVKDYFNEEDKSLTAIVGHEFIYGTGIDNSLRDTYLRLCGNLYIRNPTELYARYISRFNTPVYRYEFSYRAVSSQNPVWLKAALGEEIVFLFPPQGMGMGRKDELVMRQLLTSWISFINTGEVVVAEKKWELFDEDTKIIVRINEEGYMENTTSHFLDRYVNFWRSVFPSIENITKRERQCQKGNDDATRTLANYNMAGHYLAGLLILVAIFLTVAIAKYVKGNWPKLHFWRTVS